MNAIRGQSRWLWSEGTCPKILPRVGAAWPIAAHNHRALAVARLEPLVEWTVCGRPCASPVDEENKARRYFVSGSVQGVGFRYYARRAAQRLGLAGYVKNLSDGRVEVLAMGAPASLETFRTDLQRGPQSASVSDVVEEEAAAEPHYAGAFKIAHDDW